MLQVSRIAGCLLSFGVGPLPVSDFRHVLAVLVDVLLVLDKLICHGFLFSNVVVTSSRSIVF